MTEPKRWLGWTEKQWAASIMASLYGAPGAAALLVGLWLPGLCFIAVALWLFWALSTARPRG